MQILKKKLWTCDAPVELCTLVSTLAHLHQLKNKCGLLHGCLLTVGVK